MARIHAVDNVRKAGLTAADVAAEPIPLDNFSRQLSTHAAADLSDVHSNASVPLHSNASVPLSATHITS
jgi:hypothetical protein